MSTPQRRIGYLFDSIFNRESSILNKAVQWNLFLKEGHRQNANGFDAVLFDSTVRNTMRQQFEDEFSSLQSRTTSQTTGYRDVSGLGAADILETELGESIAEEISFRQLQFGRGRVSNLTEGFFDDNSGLSNRDQARNLFRTIYKDAGEDGFDVTQPLSRQMETVIQKLDSQDATPRELGLLRIFNETKNDLDNVDSTMERVNFEFDRFMAEQGEASLLNKFSASGRAYVRARQTIRNTKVRHSAQGRDTRFNSSVLRMENDLARGVVRDASDPFSTNVGIDRARYLNDMTGAGSFFINKPGVLPIMSLFESAQKEIVIDIFQLQNKTVSAYLQDTIARKASVAKSQGTDFKVKVRLAYPRNFKPDDPTATANIKNQAALDKTTYSILGPNLIEIQKLAELNEKLMSLGLNARGENVIDIQLEDRKFHPKLLYTDQIAMIGSANLTNPIGSSINQAGANFEQMMVVRNKMTDQQMLDFLKGDEYSDVSDAEKRGGMSDPRYTDLTQTLLHRQLTHFTHRDKDNMLFYHNKSVRDRRGSFGLAGDIQEHLVQTLDTLEGIAGDSKVFRKRHIGTSTSPTKNSKGVSMFFILDQSFLLQYARGLGLEKGKVNAQMVNAGVRGEMGSESDEALKEFVTEDRVGEYRRIQKRVLTGLARNLIVTTVDTKNYRATVFDPLVKLIESDTQLKKVYQEHNMDFRRLAAADLYDGGDASSLQAQHERLRALGFEDESVRLQIMAIASGNIRMAGAPKSHTKSFGLFTFDRNQSTGAILEQTIRGHSYYLGSSNLGQYSLAFRGDEAYSASRRLVNTEYGFMVGSQLFRKIGDHKIRTALGSNGAHPLINDYDSREAQLGFEVQDQINRIRQAISSRKNTTMADYSLTAEQEWAMAQVSMTQMVHTWSQLGNNQITNSNYLAVSNKPLWSDDIDTSGLRVLKSRIEKMARISDMGSAFDVYFKTSAQGDRVQSLQVNIDLAKALGQSSNYGDISGDALGLKRITFEMTVLNSNRRGEGNVLFLKQNKLISNSIFHNSTTNDISMIFGEPIADNATNKYGSIDYKSRESPYMLRAGRSARLSSLDTTVFLLGTLIHESMSRGVQRIDDVFQTASSTQRKAFYEDYLLYLMSGQKEKFIYDSDGITARHSARDLLLGGKLQSVADGTRNVVGMAGAANLQFLLESLETRFGVNGKGGGLSGLDKVQHLNPKWEEAKAQLVNSSSDGSYLAMKRRAIGAVRDSIEQLMLADSPSTRIHALDKAFTEAMDDLIRIAPEIALDVMTKQSNPLVKAQLGEEFRAFQQLLFEPFGRFDEIQKYGGNQISSKNLILGLNPGDEAATERLTAEMNEMNPNIRNIRGFNRLIGSTHTATTRFGSGAIFFRGIADASINSPTFDSTTDITSAGLSSRGFTQAYSLDAFSSFGIGTVTYREDLIKKISEDAALSDLLGPEGINRMQQAVRAQYRGVNAQLTFYTGDSSKVAQLPQRIKNAAGARPLMAMTIEAQKIYDKASGYQTSGDVGNMKDLIHNYLYAATGTKDLRSMGMRTRVEKILDTQAQRIKDLKLTFASDPNNAALEKEILQMEDRIHRGYANFFDEQHKIGAIFGGIIKKVVTSDQAAVIERERKMITETLGMQTDSWFKTYDELDRQNKEEAEKRRVADELLRVIVLKMSVSNAGVGNMIAGSKRYGGHSIAMIQLGGLYIDTFYANPDFGSVEGMGVRGMREGYIQEMMTGIKAGMVGVGGVRSLIADNDMIVFDSDMNRFVHMRNGQPAHDDAYVSANNTIKALENVVENDMWSKYNTDGALGTTQKSIFHRVGEYSVEHILKTQMMHGGSFEKNEMYYMDTLIRSLVAGTGRRVEGIGSGALIKGVANFIGGDDKEYGDAFKYRLYDEYGKGYKELSYWEYLAEQQSRKYKSGHIGGAMAVHMGRSGGRLEHRQISGLYNPNNIKSFFWSHGSVIMRDTQKLNSLFDVNLGREIGKGGANEIGTTQKTISKKILAKRLASSLVMAFGTGWVMDNERVQKLIRDDNFDSVTAFRRDIYKGVAQSAMKGDLGVHYRQVAMASALLSGSTDSQKQFEAIASTLGRVTDDSMHMSLLSALDGDLVQRVLSGAAAETEYDTFISKLSSITKQYASKARGKEYITVDDPFQRTAAAMVTAMDFMHQVADDHNMTMLPTDVDWSDINNRQKLLNLLGVSDAFDPEKEKDYIQMMIGNSQKVTTLLAYMDIHFSLSKDPTGAQKVARHEYQHLLKPMMGDINQFGKHGDVRAAGRVVASFHAALGNTSALHYVTNTGLYPNVQNIFDSGVMSSRFFKRQFMGFYFSYGDNGEVKSLIRRYKQLTAANYKATRIVNNKKIQESLPGDLMKALIMKAEYQKYGKDDNRFPKDFDPDAEIRKIEGELLDIESRLALYHSKFLADPTKNFGVDNARTFLNAMDNGGHKRMSFSMPGIDVSLDSTTGRYIARTDRNKSTFVYVPSSRDIKTMGMQWGDFVDDMISNYKNVIMGFAPGTMLNNVLMRMHSGLGDDGIELTDAEASALLSFQKSASEMLKTVAETSVGVKVQQMMGGKTKYQGHVATGIGSWLVPSSGVLLPSAKLTEAGLIKDPANHNRSIALGYTQDQLDMLTLGARYSNDGLFGTKTKLAQVRVEKDIAESHIKLKTSFDKLINKYGTIEGINQAMKANDVGPELTSWKKALSSAAYTAMRAEVIDSSFKRFTQGVNYYMDNTLLDPKKQIDRNAVYKIGMAVFQDLYKSKGHHYGQLKRTLIRTREKSKIYSQEIVGLLETQRRALISGIDADHTKAFKGIQDASQRFNSRIQKLKNLAGRGVSGKSAYNSLFGEVQRELRQYIQDARKSRGSVNSSQGNAYVKELQLRDAQILMSQLQVQHAEYQKNVLGEATNDFQLELHQARISAYTNTYGKGKGLTIALGGLAGLTASGIVKKQGKITSLSIYSFEGKIGGNVKQDSSAEIANLELMNKGRGTKRFSIKDMKNFVSDAIGNKIKIFEYYDSQVNRLVSEIDASPMETQVKRKYSTRRTMMENMNGDLILDESITKPVRHIDLHEQNVDPNSGKVISISREGVPEAINSVRNKITAKVLYKQGTERSKTIRSQLEILKTQVAGAESVDQLRTILQKVEDTVVTHDFRNLSTAEVFRSPPFGGTDPRAIGGFRIIEDVMAINNYAFSIMRNMGDEFAGTGTGGVQMLSYNAARSQTAMMLNPVGRITANLGDWDGDPYSSILKDMTGSANEIQQKKNARYLKSIEYDNTIRSLQNTLRTTTNAARRERIKQKITSKLVAKRNMISTFDKQIKDIGTFIEGMRKEVTDNMEGRLRTELGNYMGVNEDYFIELAQNNPDSDEKVLLKADSLFTFLEFGRSLFSGIEEAGGTFKTFRDSLMPLFDFDKGVDDFMTQLNKYTGDKKGSHYLMERADKLLKNAVEGQELTGEARKVLNILSMDNDALEGADALRIALTSGFEQVKSQIETQQKIRAGLGEEFGIDDVRGLMARWIGSDMYQRIAATKELSGMFKKSSGMTMEDTTFDTLVKTLGKAGGEVLGKAYNTLVGSMYADSPILALQGSLDRMSESQRSSLESSIDNMFRGKADNEVNKMVSALRGGQSSAQGDRTGKGRGNVGQAFLSALRDQNDFSKGLQAYLKNINQLLRDSIKFKSGTDMMDQLNDLARDFNEGPEELSGEARDAKIREMAYHLGPGGGIIGLIRLERLVTNEKVSLERLRSEFGVSMGRTLDKNNDASSFEEAYFRSITSRIIDHTKDKRHGDYLTEGDIDKLYSRAEDRNTFDVTTDDKVFRQVAKYTTAQDMVRMVSSFRYEKALDAGQIFRDQVSEGQRKSFLAQILDGVQNKVLNKFSDLNSGDTEYAIDKLKADFEPLVGKARAQKSQDIYLSLLKDRYGISNTAYETKVFHQTQNIEAREALGEYLFGESARRQMYEVQDGQLALSKTYIDKINEMNKGDEMLHKLALFDEIYYNTRKQTKPWLGMAGEGLDHLTTVDKFRKEVGGILLVGNGITEPEKVNSILDTSKDTPGELLHTLSQLSSQGKLDKQGAVIFSQMMKGAFTALMEDAGLDFENEFQNLKGRGPDHSQKNKQVRQSIAMKTITKAMLTGSLRAKAKAEGRSINNQEQVEIKTREAVLADVLDALVDADSSDNRVAISQIELMDKQTYKHLMDQQKSKEAKGQQILRDRIEEVLGAGEKAETQYLSQLEKEVGPEAVIKYNFDKSQGNLPEDKMFVRKTSYVSFMELLDDSFSRTGEGIRINSLQEMAKQMGSAVYDDSIGRGDSPEALGKYATHLLQLSGNTSEDQVEVVKSYLREGMQEQHTYQAWKRQSFHAKTYQMQKNMGFVRGSLSDKLSKNAIRTLNDNRKLNTLEALVPVALTILGSAIQHGRTEGDIRDFKERLAGDAQTLVGSSIMAMGYSRAGFASLQAQGFAGAAKTAQSIGMGAAIAGTYKLRSSLYNSGGNYGSAIMESFARELTAGTVNALVAPRLTNYFQKMAGVGNPTKALHFDRYAATKQGASSMLGVITSAVVSNIMATVVGSQAQKHLFGNAKRESWDKALSAASENIIAMQQERTALQESLSVGGGSEEDIQVAIEIVESYFSEQSQVVSDAIANGEIEYDNYTNPGAGNIAGEQVFNIFEGQPAALTS